MFIRNPKSIKRPTIRVSNEVKEILDDIGFRPISFEDGEWIYLKNDYILGIVLDIDENLKMGGVKHGHGEAT